MASRSPSPPVAFRAHARRVVRLHALAVHEGAGWERWALVENVGLGGACIGVDEPLAVGDALSLSITSPALWEPLGLRGRVAWVRMNAPLREHDERMRGASSAQSTSHRAGIAFDHRTREGVVALHELIQTFVR